MIDFHWPWALLLAPVPMLLIARRKAAADRAMQNPIDVPPALARALESIEQQQSARRHGLPQRIAVLCLGLSWLAFVIAIAQPSRPAATEWRQGSGRALTLLIDLSTSMERKDFTMQGEPVDRLTIVKSIASQFIAGRSGDRIGLVLFGSEAAIAAPPSFDLNAINQVLLASVAGLTGRTTAIGDGLGLAIRTLQNDEAGDKAIILLSDGTNNAGSVEPEDAARLAASVGITIHAIGLGSADTDGQSDQQSGFQSASADLDEATLEAIATASGGQYFRARTSEELQMIYRRIDQLERATEQLPPVIATHDLRNLFAATALLLLLASTAINTRRTTAE